MIKLRREKIQPFEKQKNRKLIVQIIYERISFWYITFEVKKKCNSKQKNLQFLDNSDWDAMERAPLSRL